MTCSNVTQTNVRKSDLIVLKCLVVSKDLTNMKYSFNGIIRC